MKITVGVTHFDDYSGAWQTLTGILTNHPEVLEHCEFVIVDNNPGSQHGKALRHFVTKRMRNWTSHESKYIPFSDRVGVAPARNELFRQASGDFVLCIDSHVVFENDSLSELVSYLDHAAVPPDLLTGPIVMDDGRTTYTHQIRQWTRDGYGVWATQVAGIPDHPFEIQQHGLGVFCTRRAGWPGFHPDMDSFGCVESVLCEKFRQREARVMCLPFLKWHHRFSIYVDPPYPITEYNKARNHLIGFNEVGWDLIFLLKHFKYRLSEHERSMLTDEFLVEWN